MAVATSRRKLQGHNLQTMKAADGNYRSVVVISFLNDASWDGRDFTDAGRYVCQFTNESMTSFTPESDAPPPPSPRGRRG